MHTQFRALILRGRTGIDLDQAAIEVALKSGPNWAQAKDIHDIGIFFHFFNQMF